ncbi:hypothetical protein C8Q80DRAFT_826278 [Daedaleopsis nitida]|nr:hypothetical protein C8Q80DRAFT_826278 [Daedaleopsis nitida]
MQRWYAHERCHCAAPVHTTPVLRRWFLTSCGIVYKIIWVALSSELSEIDSLWLNLCENSQNFRHNLRKSRLIPCEPPTYIVLTISHRTRPLSRRSDEVGKIAFIAISWVSGMKSHSSSAQAAQRPRITCARVHMLCTACTICFRGQKRRSKFRVFGPSPWAGRGQLSDTRLLTAAMSSYQHRHHPTSCLTRSSRLTGRGTCGYRESPSTGGRVLSPISRATHVPAANSCANHTCEPRVPGSVTIRRIRPGRRVQDAVYAHNGANFSGFRGYLERITLAAGDSCSSTLHEVRAAYTDV